MEIIRDYRQPLYRRKEVEGIVLETEYARTDNPVFQTLGQTSENVKLYFADTISTPQPIRNYFQTTTIPLIKNAIEAIPDWFKPSEFEKHSEVEYMQALINKEKTSPSKDTPIAMLDISKITMSIMQENLSNTDDRYDKVISGVSNPPTNLQEFYLRMQELQEVFTEISRGTISPASRMTGNDPLRRTMGFLKVASGLHFKASPRPLEQRQALQHSFESSDRGSTFREQNEKERSKQRLADENRNKLVNKLLEGIEIDLP